MYQVGLQYVKKKRKKEKKRQKNYMVKNKS